jgi:hypothetical protein
MLIHTSFRNKHLLQSSVFINLLHHNVHETKNVDIYGIAEETDFIVSFWGSNSKSNYASDFIR